MAGAGLGNPAGYVPIFDGANPRIVGGVARVNLSGGVFAFGSTATGVVGSVSSTFVTSDIKFAGDASGAQFNGVIVQSASSGTEIAVATRGSFLLQCNGTVVGGEVVGCDGNNAVQPIGSTKISLAKGASKVMGRALTAGASGGFALIDIRA